MLIYRLFTLDAQTSTYESTQLITKETVVTDTLNWRGRNHWVSEEFDPPTYPVLPL